MNHFSKIKCSFLAVFLFLFLLTSPQTLHPAFAASGDICTGVYPTTGVSTPGACVTRSNCTGANILANSSCADSTLVCCKGSVSATDACTGIYPTTGVSTSGACVALNNCTGANILANGSCGNSTLVCCKNGASTASACAPPNSCVSGFACKDGASSAVGICGSGSICCQPSNIPSTTATTNPSYNYTLLEKIPGSDSTNLSFSAYLSAIYKLAIWIVGLCALFMFLIGAFMYMLSAANTSKMGSAKEIMQDALIGLVLALTSYLILYVINPDLVNLKLPSVSMPAGTGAATSTSTGTSVTRGTQTPGATWPDDSSIRNDLKAAKISLNRGNCSTEGDKSTPCTSVAELGGAAISGLKNLKTACTACHDSDSDIMVNGGTEYWFHGENTSHQKGNSVVDLNRTPDLLAYLQQSGQVACTRGNRPVYRVNGIDYWDEDNKHFHVNFGGSICK